MKVGMMKRLMAVLTLCVVWSVPAWADFQAGGAAYERGDYVTAFQEFKPLAEQGEALAQSFLGYMYETGKGVAQDYTQAVKWYRKAADQGDVKAQSLLGYKYANGQGVAQDYAQAVKWYSKAAEQGDALAQLNLGGMYRGGLGVPQDDAQAVKWYRKAADQGDVKAQSFLGFMYDRGQGVVQDYAQAIKWYLKAAEQGEVKLQPLLGFMYETGQGVAQDYAQAVKWYRKAAEQGDASAQYRLGFMYDRGQGVTQDYAQAIKWYRKAAEQGDDAAQLFLGDMYNRGRGVTQNYVQAVKWYRKAAEQGVTLAQFALGFMYGSGKGIIKDYTQAYSWFLLAAAQGNAKAVKIRDILAKEMTPAQIAEGQRMARNWRPVQQKPTAGARKPQQATGAIPAPTTQMDIAGLQKQLQRIESLMAQKAKPINKPAPKPKAVSKFPTKPVVVKFAKARPRPNDIAVIIGNADYERGKDIPNVTPAYADAAGIRKYVKQSLGILDENIIYLKDASQASLIATFGSKDNPRGQLFNYVKPGISKVFVYYSGHGAPAGDDGNSYIVPTDAEASLIDLNGYSLKTLYKNLSKIPAKSMTVVLEACFSGASQDGTVIANASPIYLKAKETGVPSNITVIAAGAANQIASWEQDKSSGLFTKYFLKGMSGEADAKPYGNGDGKVGYDELNRYFKETLTYYARRYYGREQTAQIVVRNER